MKKKNFSRKVTATVLAAAMTMSMAGGFGISASADAGDVGDYSCLRIGVSNLCTNLNPNTITTDYNTLIYTTLATVDYTTGETVGLMGDVSWSDDMMTLNIDMWDNIYDCEGNHITASDALFCWDLAKEDGANTVNDFESWEQTGDYSLSFHLKEAPTMAGVKLPVPIFSQEAYEASSDGFATSPVYCAPYKVKEFTSDYLLVLERNDDFWATDEQKEYVENTIGGLWAQNWDTIEIYTISETTQMTVALQTGSIDYTENLAQDDLELFEEGGELEDDYYIWNKINGLTYHMQFDADEASVCSDENVRKAIAYAINTDYIIETVFRGEALGTHESGGSFLIDYDESWDTEDNYYQYDPEKSKELLAEAGYEDGLKIDLLVSSDSTRQDIAVVIQALLAEVGIDVTITALEPTIYDEYEDNPSSWDISLGITGSDDYIVNAWSKCYIQGQRSHPGTTGYYVDDTMQEMLLNVSSQEGYSQEAVQEFHEYVIERCLDYGICNKYDNVIVRDGLEYVTDPTGTQTFWNAFYWAE